MSPINMAMEQEKLFQGVFNYEVHLLTMIFSKSKGNDVRGF